MGVSFKQNYDFYFKKSRKPSVFAQIILKKIKDPEKFYDHQLSHPLVYQKRA